MNLTFFWPTLAIVVVITIWLTAYNLRRLGRADKPGPRKAVIPLALGCLAQWTVIAATIVMGYLTAGIIGGIAAAGAMLLLPMMATFIVAAATGRIRRQ